MKSTPQASVIIPLFNKEKWVEDCLNSVIRNQKHTPLECIIVDDGSTDKSVDNIKTLVNQHNWITVITQHNQGVSAARNTAIRASTTPKLLFLDADDVWDDDHAQTILQTWTEWPNATLVFSLPKILVDDVEQKHSPHIETILKNKGPVDSWFQARLMDTIILNTSTAGLQKWVWKEVDGFETQATKGEDFLMWAQASVRGPVVWTGRQTGTRHLHTDNNLTHKTPQPGEQFSEHFWYNMMEDWVQKDLPDNVPNPKQLWDDAWKLYLETCKRFGHKPQAHTPPPHPQWGTNTSQNL